MKVDSLILIYALRYSLGRMSGAASDVCEAILDNIEKFSSWELLCIVKDIEEYKSINGTLGDDFDEKAWINLIVEINKQVNK